MTCLRGVISASVPWAIAALFLAGSCTGDEPVPACETTADCGAGEQCRDGMCTPVFSDGGALDGDASISMCLPAETACGAVCADTRTDPMHCGGCEVGCGDPVGASVTCVNGLCTSRCDEGFADCDGDSANGCETDLSSDDANCGACGVRCSGGSCSASSCLVDHRGDGSDGAFSVDDGDVVLNTVRTTANGGAGRNEVILDSPAGFAPGQLVLLQQSQGPDAGRFSLHRLQSISGSVATVNPRLVVPYATGAGSVAQAVVVPQYTELSVTGGRVVAPAWTGAAGGIVAIAATGTVSIGPAGSIDVDGRGFRGTVGMGASRFEFGKQGEGDLGLGALSVAPNGSGGGGGGYVGGCARAAGGGGGGGFEAGLMSGPSCGLAAEGGTAAGGDGSLLFGGAGGEGGAFFHMGGGFGGGAIIIFAARVEVEGAIHARGAAGVPARSSSSYCGGGSGGGGGGTIYLDVDTAVLGDGLVSAAGGEGGPEGPSPCLNLFGGAGGGGRISVRGDSITGTTVPPALTP